MSQLTPHGRLLEAARGNRSKRSVAQEAGISEARWRQIVTGVQRAGGVEIPVSTKPETLVAMARAVGADPAEVLAAAGMTDPTSAPVEQPPSSDQPARRLTNRELVSELARRLGVAPEDVMTDAAPIDPEAPRVPHDTIARSRPPEGHSKVRKRPSA